jgi:hypothetical protein
MAREPRKTVIEKIMNDEIRRDLGSTPSFPIDETQVAREFENPPPVAPEGEGDLEDGPERPSNGPSDEKRG